MDIATVNSSSDKSNCTDKSPERKRMSLINCRIAMSEKAMAMSIQAIRFRVIQISLNTHNAAVNWRKIETLNTRGNLISIVPMNGPFPPLRICSIRIEGLSIPSLL